jgi:hypothetical protein
VPPHLQNNRELSKDRERERERERERSGETETGVKAEVGEGKRERLEKVAWTVGGGISAAFFSSLEKYSCVSLSVTDSEDDEEGEGTTTTPRPGFSDVMGQADGISGAAGGELNLKGCERFVRHNPRSDLFGVQRFHHIEFWYAPAGELS